MTRTLSRDFALFRRECERCIRRWKIVGWRIEFAHEKMNCRAECRTSYDSHACTLVLSSEWDGPVTNKLIRDCARHEVVHILLDDLNSIACARYTTNDKRTLALESTVRHLQELLP